MGIIKAVFFRGDDVMEKNNEYFNDLSTSTSTKSVKTICEYLGDSKFKFKNFKILNKGYLKNFDKTLKYAFNENYSDSIIISYKKFYSYKKYLKYFKYLYLINI